MLKLPKFQDVLDASKILKGQAIRTPLLKSDILNEQLNARVFFKPECLQRTGSFKFRGAYNAMQHVPESSHESGVLACSSGNHAQESRKRPG